MQTSAAACASEFRRYERDRSIVQEWQPKANLVTVAVGTGAGFGNHIPFVNRQHERLASFRGIAQYLGVLIGDAFRAIDHVHDQITAIDRSE